MRILLLILLCLKCGGVAQDFKVVTHAGKKFTTCSVDVSVSKLELFLADEKGGTFKTFARLEQWLAGKDKQLVFGMNAGMYHADYTTVGLYVENGRQIYPLNLERGEGNFFLQPNGVFYITQSGAAVLESKACARLGVKPLWATQSGPMLVINNTIHPAFNAASKSELFRNGVGVSSADKVIFVISEAAVNFHAFATLFRDTLKCPNALFLDGTVSSLYSRALGRSDFRMDLGPFFGIPEKKE